MKEVYVDNASTTKVREEVIESMLPYSNENYGNPNSLHNLGINARVAIEEARKAIANYLGADKSEIIFTGSGTESDNLAILGYCRKNKNSGKHIITTKIEHHAVLESFRQLEKEGFEVSYLDVDFNGFIRVEDLKNEIRTDTIFVSIIYANNEVGVVQDIKAISKICRETKVVLHIDACQAINYLEINVEELGVDLMSFSGSKIYGPKGVGVLFKRKNILIEPIIFGGGQENKLRSGTENVPLIVGLSKALELVCESKTEEVLRLKSLSQKLITGLLKIPETYLNGGNENKLPNIVNISFLNVEGESLLLLLNEYGIYASTGSACSSQSLNASHVLIALGLPIELAHGSIRFSLGRETTEEDIDYIIKSVGEIVERLRKMSPLKLKVDELLERARETKRQELEKRMIINKNKNNNK